MSAAEDKQKVELAIALKKMNENWVMRLDLIKFMARESRAKYLALVEQGFTEAQAIELCKGQP